ncbi:replication protein RepA [Novacetimonas hansenii]|uniref:replication protein RepA n=1 Tax=Novacetimonas hansenii TaxID=436 RepID=UPI0023DD0C6A|nr:replication protein RepA [Novacetimonas hansenii]WEQ60576.1 replication protein RepA [Novacetimonas hansenii]
MSKRKSPPEQSELVLSPTTARVIQLSAEIQATPPDDIEFMHTVLCQVGLPRKRTKETRFERNNGKASLLITAGEMYNDGHWEKLFVPYGTKPRLALFHISTEAIRTKSRTVAVGRTISEFMKRLNISQNGPSREAFRAQMNALCACEMKLGYGSRNLNARPVDEFDAWTKNLAKDSTIELSEKFWHELKENAVPLDPRALEGLQHSALALDIYTWLAHRLHRVRGIWRTAYLVQPSATVWAGIYGRQEFQKGIPDSIEAGFGCLSGCEVGAGSNGSEADRIAASCPETDSCRFSKSNWIRRLIQKSGDNGRCNHHPLDGVSPGLSRCNHHPFSSDPSLSGAVQSPPLLSPSQPPKTRCNRHPFWRKARLCG